MPGKVAIVTGAGPGIGREIATALAGQRCRLALCSRSGRAGETAAELRRAGFDAFAESIDVSDPEQFGGFVMKTLERYERVDILVNNAAVNHSGSALSMPAEQFDEVFATNVKGVFFAVQAGAAAMIRSGGGRVVNIASFVGRTPVALFTAYSASKAAVLSLTRGLALELAEHEITVNAVCPGNVWSDIWTSSTPAVAQITGKDPRELFADAVASQPIRRPQTGAEIAAATVFLCGEQARNITGEAIFVSGGL
jgi:NAD(P)-dependent dehydrogenase (short-subunit alcohol dehydrogenase family)